MHQLEKVPLSRDHHQLTEEVPVLRGLLWEIS